MKRTEHSVILISCFFFFIFQRIAYLAGLDGLLLRINMRSYEGKHAAPHNVGNFYNQFFPIKRLKSNLRVAEVKTWIQEREGDRRVEKAA